MLTQFGVARPLGIRILGQAHPETVPCPPQHPQMRQSGARSESCFANRPRSRWPAPIVENTPNSHIIKAPRVRLHQPVKPKAGCPLAQAVATTSRHRRRSMAGVWQEYGRVRRQIHSLLRCLRAPCLHATSCRTWLECSQAPSPPRSPTLPVAPPSLPPVHTPPPFANTHRHRCLSPFQHSPTTPTLVAQPRSNNPLVPTLVAQPLSTLTHNTHSDALSPFNTFQLWRPHHRSARAWRSRA